MGLHEHTGEAVDSEPGSASGIILEFGALQAKARTKPPSAYRLTIEEAFVQGDGTLCIRGEVVSPRTVSAIDIYVGQDLVERKTFPWSGPEQYQSFNFECEATLETTTLENTVKVTCTDIWGLQTSGSRTFDPKRGTPSVTPDKLLQAQFIANALGLAFDAEYYAQEYPDLEIERSQLILHFIECGWFEGRNPNAFFDTVSYFLDHEDVAKAAINPFVHYLTAGRSEGRKVSPSISPSVRSQLLFGYEIKNWVERLRPVVDVESYRRQLPNRVPPKADLVAHFAYRGWREGLSPNTKFDTSQWLDRYPASSRYLVNPVIIQFESESGAFNLDLLNKTPPNEAPPPPPACIPESESVNEDRVITGFVADQARLAVVEKEFSSSYYLATYPDVAKAGVSPLEHFYYTGWRESRCPNQDFDTKYYLEANEDVAKAELNPFWHFIVSGRAEGRLPRRPGGYRREIIDAAEDPSNIAYAGGEIDPVPLSLPKFKRALRRHTAGSQGLVVSLSHDCYVENIGGTQIFIADEQQRFNDHAYTYIHISPRTSRLVLLQENDANFLVRVVVNGKLIGVLLLSTLLDFIKAHTKRNPSILIVHCMLGFHAPDVIQLFEHLRPARSIYWLHDYSSVCSGFNLLRNDVQFCGAPSHRSTACRICVYGKSRQAHLEDMYRLFEACQFEVASPSNFTLHLWHRSASLPHKRAFVHQHWKLMAKEKKRRNRSSSKMRIAFVGFPASHKGWPLFKEIVRRVGLDDRYEFFHFAARNTPSLLGVNFVTTEVTSEDRNATAKLLAANRIDVVLLLSPWPETFSFVLHEAISVGARIFCLSDSGNVAAVVSQLGCGTVFTRPEDILDFFDRSSGGTRPSRSPAAPLYDIEAVGTTGTIEGIFEAQEQVR